jgi:hypothetical protein
MRGSVSLELGGARLDVETSRLPAHIGRRQSGRMLLQHLDDLLFGKSALAHVRLRKERTLPKIGDIYGEQVRGLWWRTALQHSPGLIQLGELSAKRYHVETRPFILRRPSPLKDLDPSGPKAANGNSRSRMEYAEVSNRRD